MTANDRLRQLLTFGAVGLAATATHASVALVAHTVVDMPALAANLLGYMAAVLVSYVGNARLTFGKRVALRAQFVRFLVVSVLALGLNQMIVYYCTGLLGWPFAVSLALVVTVVPLFSFFMAKLWAFADAAPSSR